MSPCRYAPAADPTMPMADRAKAKPVISRTCDEMIARMAPDLRPGEFVFVTTREDSLAQTLLPGAVALFREDEGFSLIVPLALAQDSGLGVDHPMRCITLSVHSALDGVGLTAAVSAALGRQGVPCNMVAAYHHDHVFVPSAMAERALAILAALQASGQDGG